MTSPSPSMPPANGLIRVAMVIEYDGSGYLGLQRQSQGPTIQSELEKAISTFGIEDCVFRASGRTDSGVHARGQVVAVWLPESLREKNICSAVNWHLPDGICVRKAVECHADFDPRRDARLRTYRYLLCGGQAFPALMHGRMGHQRSQLDLEKMEAAAEVLTGVHDFIAWRSSMCQARRTELDLKTCTVRPWRDRAAHGADTQCFEFILQCRSFLHRMVRFLVGGMVLAGRGRLEPDKLEDHLKAMTLPDGVKPVEACGLSLEHVWYPTEKNLFGDSPLPTF